MDKKCTLKLTPMRFHRDSHPDNHICQFVHLFHNPVQQHSSLPGKIKQLVVSILVVSVAEPAEP